MAHRTLLMAVSLVLAFTLAAGSALAAAGGGNKDKPKPTCQSGFVYDPNTKTCVQQGSSVIDDEELYEQGRALAKAGRYEDSLALLTAVKDRGDAEVLTMIGYATRKLGKIDEGMAYYHQALAIDPDNADTREYLGEAYVQKDELVLALGELYKIKALCGTECEQYEDLAAAISGHVGEW